VLAIETPALHRRRLRAVHVSRLQLREADLRRLGSSRRVLRINNGTDRIPAFDQVGRPSAGDAEMSKTPTTIAPEDFVAVAVPLIRRDSGQNFVSEAYRSAIRVATKAQQELLAAEIDRLKIKTEHTV
jgi:hypothetical protein